MCFLVVEELPLQNVSASSDLSQCKPLGQNVEDAVASSESHTAPRISGQCIQEVSMLTTLNKIRTQWPWNDLQVTCSLNHHVWWPPKDLVWVSAWVMANWWLTLQWPWRTWASITPLIMTLSLLMGWSFAKKETLLNLEIGDELIFSVVGLCRVIFPLVTTGVL